jgi:hypothetical protein
MVWRQERSPNGEAVVFDSIETFVSFSFVWSVCVAASRTMTKWQRSYQGRCARQKSRGAMAEGCVVVKISNVFLVFYSREIVRVGFLDLNLKGKYKRIRCAIYLGRQSFYVRVGIDG